ncbi:unnamed protein product [Gongylonema pulchrum]|uniref:DET1- and DDB1-associated protein 1 n=1 Tax=Gongylonema pulchrum TaxID=637853 RepID=A0A183ENN2_9BILA|nr:unnamed protein product [Gongylonema pulchrum]
MPDLPSVSQLSPDTSPPSGKHSPAPGGTPRWHYDDPIIIAEKYYTEMHITRNTSRTAQSTLAPSPARNVHVET